jgi:hypothetical protein
MKTPTWAPHARGEDGAHVSNEGLFVVPGGGQEPRLRRCVLECGRGGDRQPPTGS